MKSLASPHTCPGGVPVGGASIAGIDVASINNMQFLWIHVPDTWPNNSVELLRCQSTTACMEPSSGSSNASSRRLNAWNRSEPWHPAHCGPGHKMGSFLCGQCADGWVKIGGDCVECPSFSWGMTAFTIIGEFIMALFLLHKSVLPIVGKQEVGEIWDKIDIEEKGILPQEKVGKVLELLGSLDPVPVSCPKDSEKAKNTQLRQLDQRTSKLQTMCDEFVQSKDGAKQTKICCCCCKKQQEEPKLDRIDAEILIKKHEFLKVRESKAPTASLATAIFFLQSLGLMIRDQGAGFLEALNLGAQICYALYCVVSSPVVLNFWVRGTDPQQTVKECISPLDTITMFDVKALGTPVILIVGAFSEPLTVRIKRLMVAHFRHIRDGPSVEFCSENSYFGQGLGKDGCTGESKANADTSGAPQRVSFLLHAVDAELYSNVDLCENMRIRRSVWRSDGY